jgi:putative N6-adenine-specific DNA methylase
MSEAPDSLPFRLLLPCAIGIERSLGNELRHLGLTIRDSGPGRFEVGADERGLLSALRCLRTAERVLAVLAEFKAYTFEDLFQGCLAIDWALWLPKESRVHIDRVRIHQSTLNSVASVQSVAQKAIYKRLGEQYHLNRLPETGPEHQVRIYVENNVARVCLDLSGEALHRRGYRTKAGEAPLKETIAAAMVILSGWRRKFPFHDPFCGAGTLAAEALSFAYDLAPNLNRVMGFCGMNNYPAALDRELQAELLARVNPEYETELVASDYDPRMVELTRQSIRNLVEASGLPKDSADRIAARVRVEQCRMENLKGRQGQGHFLANPPYGERLGDLPQAQATYRAMGGLARVFPDWSLTTITTWAEFDRDIGQRSTWMRPIRNGNSEAFIYHHEFGRGTGRVR